MCDEHVYSLVLRQNKGAEFESPQAAYPIDLSLHRLSPHLWLPFLSFQPGQRPAVHQPAEGNYCGVAHPLLLGVGSKASGMRCRDGNERDWVKITTCQRDCGWQHLLARGCFLSLRALAHCHVEKGQGSMTLLSPPSTRELSTI